MENTTSTPVASGETTATNKKIVERSASYPVITLEDAISLVTQIYKTFTASASVKREDVARVVDDPGYINRNIAAAVQYGLLVRESGEYKITPLFLPIYQPVTEAEKSEALIAAFKSPKLYKELIQKYDRHAVPTEDALAIVLFRQHDITEKASKQAAEVFLKSGKFVGAINNIGILNTGSPVISTQVQQENVQQIFDTPPPPPPTANDNQQVQIIDDSVQTKILKLTDGATEEKLVIHLTEKKKAVLVYPSNFNAKDIEVLKSQIDVLAILIT